MGAFLTEWYLWIKAFHIISVIAWMAGIFYLPRLFVYHTREVPGSDGDKRFQEMEGKLLRVIMNPAMTMTWVFGLMLFFTPGLVPKDVVWFWVKISAVLVMTGFHHALAAWRKDFVAGLNSKSEKFFRRANEIPTVLMMIIVIMVVVRPF